MTDKHRISYVSAQIDGKVGVVQARLDIPNGLESDVLKEIARVAMAGSHYEHVLRTVLKRIDRDSKAQWVDAKTTIAKATHKLIGDEKRGIAGELAKLPEDTAEKAREIIREANIAVKGRNDVMHGLWVDVGAPPAVWIRSNELRDYHADMLRQYADTLIECANRLNECIPAPRPIIS